MFRGNFFIFTSLFLCFLFCLNADAQSLLKKNKIPKDLIITLERTPCFGNCRHYELTIKADGSVFYHPISVLQASPVNDGKFLVTNGRYKIGKNQNLKNKLSKTQLRELVSEFEKIDFFNLRDSYSKAEDGCTKWITDQPSQIISIQINGKSKKVNLAEGCFGIPDSLKRSLLGLGSRIDRLINYVKIEIVK